jgi:hypothetical protein
MDVASSNRSRRSFPNLQHLSLAPLSSRFPIDDDGVDQEYDGGYTQVSSYIQGKSMPTTPSILSRDPSQHRKAKKRVSHQDSLSLEIEGHSITKAQSSSALLAQDGYHHARRSTGTYSPTAPRRAQHRSQNNDEWLHRAGLVIASEMRETKGQSWLVSRDSSTSLVDQSTYDLRSVLTTDQFADDEDSPMTPRYSRNASRVASRAPSARTSRRGSRVGSRVDMMSAIMTPMEGKTPGAWAAEGYFDDIATTAEPDFLEAEDDGAVDDEEVSRLAKQKGFGLGGIVDRLVGFSLFNVDEDGEEEEEEDEADETVEEATKRKQEHLRRRREQLERAASSSAVATGRAEKEAIRPPIQGDDGGWKDAAWLLSVASKVLY